MRQRLKQRKKLLVKKKLPKRKPGKLRRAALQQQVIFVEPNAKGVNEYFKLNGIKHIHLHFKCFFSGKWGETSQENWR